jgi:hypothetical protein
LSRHRKIQCGDARSGVVRSRTLRSGRSRAVALIAAGAFTVATAATAVAVTWPSEPPGRAVGHPHEAGISSLLTLNDQPVQIQAFHQSTANQAVAAYQVRDVAARLSAAHVTTARQQAAKNAAAKKAAAATAAHAAARSRAGSAAQPTTGAQPAPAATVTAASGSPQQIAQVMLASFGWSSGQFSCLDPLWAHESGWSVTAYNAGSGAYGIPQALPGSRMASAGPDWQTNAATQIRWGLEYIRGTYGSPCGAWDHEQATGWY